MDKPKTAWEMTNTQRLVASSMAPKQTIITAKAPARKRNR